MALEKMTWGLTDFDKFIIWLHLTAVHTPLMDSLLPGNKLGGD